MLVNVALPIRFSETPVRKPSGAPLLGSQTRDALRRMPNCDEERLAQLAVRSLRQHMIEHLNELRNHPFNLTSREN